MKDKKGGSSIQQFYQIGRNILTDESRCEKTGYYLCKNKAADQLCSNCTADQRRCFHFMDSTIPPLLIPKILRFYLSSVRV